MTRTVEVQKREKVKISSSGAAWHMKKCRREVFVGSSGVRNAEWYTPERNELLATGVADRHGFAISVLETGEFPQYAGNEFFDGSAGVLWDYYHTTSFVSGN